MRVRLMRWRSYLEIRAPALHLVIGRVAHEEDGVGGLAWGGRGRGRHVQPHRDLGTSSKEELQRDANATVARQR